MKAHELLIKEGLITKQDWKRIGKYTDAHLKRHTKLIHLSTIDKSTICFGQHEIPKLNYN